MCAYDCEVLGEQVNKVYLDAKHTRQGRVDTSPALSPWAADTQMTEVTERIICQVFMQINEKKCTFLQDGVPVTPLKLNGETETIRAHITDFATMGLLL